MTPDDKQMAAFKLMADWCKWFVGIETLAIGGIATLVNHYEKTGLPLPSLLLFSYSILMFAISVVFTAGVFTSLPEAMVYIKPDEGIWDRIVTMPFWHLREKKKVELKLWWVVDVQALTFILGLLALALGMIVLPFGHSMPCLLSTQ